MSKAIRVNTKNGKCTVRFTRPELRNPLSVEVIEELDRIVDSVAGDPTIKDLVFTGADDVFASGANIREIAEVTVQNAREFALRGQRLMHKISDLPQTTTALINGYCYGGALDLALACNNRIASPNATFSHPGTGLGIITGWGGTQRLPRLIGEANALKMFFTAEPIRVDEALRIGLVDSVAEK